LDFDNFNEGAGFGRTDYRNVTGDATTSGYLADTQHVGGAGSTIATDLPRSQWHEPQTVIVGLRKDVIKDPYFLRKRRVKKRSKKDYKDRKRDEQAEKFNDQYELPRH
jgi:hypothetical protein